MTPQKGAQMKYPTFLLTLAILIATLTTTASAQTAVQASMDEYRKGRAFLDAKDYPRAIEHLSRSIAIKPSSGAYMDLGISYSYAKKHENAILAFKEVVRTVPNNAEVHYWIGRTYINLATDKAAATGTKDFSMLLNAEAEAREAIRLQPVYPRAYYVLGQAFYVQGKLVEAVSALQQVLRTNPEDQPAMYFLALAYAKLGRKNEAMQLYNKLVLLDRDFAADLLTRLNAIGNTANNTQPNSTTPAAPGSADYSLKEGHKYRDAKNYAQAIASYKRAIALKPALHDAHFNLGYCQYLLNQYPLALTSFQQALKLQPNDNSNHYWVGVTNYQLKRYQPALASLQEAVRLKPNDAYSHHWIGEVYAEGFKEYEKAIPEYRESIRLEPNYALSRNQLGLAYSQTDEFEMAITAFQEAIRIKPAEPLYYSNLGFTYLDLGRREDAVAVQRKLATLDQAKAQELAKSIEANFPADKDNVEFLSVLAVVVRDRPDTSLKIYRRVLLLSKTPGEKASAYSGMGDAYKAKNSEQKALAAYQQALSLYQQLVRLKPNEGYLLYGLGHSFLGLGQKEQATRIYRRLQTVAPNFAKDLLAEINKTK